MMVGELLGVQMECVVCLGALWCGRVVRGVVGVRVGAALLPPARSRPCLGRRLFVRVSSSRIRGIGVIRKRENGAVMSCC